MKARKSKFPWLYLITYNRCPVSVYSTAWRALACMVCMIKEGFNDLNLYKVTRYRLSNSDGVETDIEVVTDSFLRSVSNYK